MFFVALLAVLTCIALSCGSAKNRRGIFTESEPKILTDPNDSIIQLIKPDGPPYFIVENEHVIMKLNYDEFVGTPDTLSPYYKMFQNIGLLGALAKESRGIRIHGPCFKPVLKSFPDNACLTYDYVESLPILLEHKYICSINGVEIDSVLINGKPLEKYYQIRLWSQIKYNAAYFLQAGKAIVIDKSNNVETNKILYGQIEESSCLMGKYYLPDGRLFLEILEEHIYPLYLDMDF